MLGVKMKTDSRAFVNYLRTKGLLTVAAGDNVMRVLPPLTIEEEHIREFVETLSAAASEYEVPAEAAKVHRPPLNRIGAGSNLTEGARVPRSGPHRLSSAPRMPILPRCQQFSSTPTSRSASPSLRAMRGGGSRGWGR